MDDYCRHEQNPEYLLEIKNLEGAALEAKLQRLAFGTAGLRAPIGSGYCCMNELVVIQTSQALYSCIKPTRVVIGYDHRYGSVDFARVAANVFAYMKCHVTVLGQCHTPLVPFAIGQLNACLGLMFTASHNPKTDNGLKVYAANGCQIVSPTDKEVEKLLLRPEILKPWIWEKSLQTPFIVQSNDMADIYFHKLFPKQNLHQCFRFCYTPMHGVGLEFANRALESLGFSNIPVDSQALPDPDFPTAAFPNPEEPGAFNEAIKCARQNACHVIFSNDPDADRFAVAELTHNDEYRVFNGNELGALFAYFCLPALPNSAMISTIVSSKLVQKICKLNDIAYFETNTGFKNIGNKAIELEKEGYNVIFAYEEAIGFMCNPLIKDKDGISALAFFAAKTNQIYEQGMTLESCLNNINKKYGMHIQSNGYVKKSVDETRKIIEAFEANLFSDLVNFEKSKSQIKLEFSNNVWIMLRPSGTEPKLKYYSETVCDDLEAGKTNLQDSLQKIFDVIAKLSE